MAEPKPYMKSETVGNLLSALDEALDLLQEFSGSGDLVVMPDQTPASLLEQCLDLCAQHSALPPEPVRTLHHFACAGGTLISKCVSAMPNMQVLSEVDPLSTMQLAPVPRFAPTDMGLLMRQSTRGVSEDLLVEIFLASLAPVIADCARKGQRLLLRDHAHSHYCYGPAIPDRPGLREIVQMRFPVVSVVTVRHPLDSYLSLLANQWISYVPLGLDEYCRRYLAFLKDHAGLPVIRYERFVNAPQQQMRELCSALQLPHADDFVDLFDVFRLTGDSGRAGSFIGQRKRRGISDDLMREVESSSHYRQLCGQLLYD